MIPGESGVNIVALGPGELKRTSFFIGFGLNRRLPILRALLKEAIKKANKRN